MEALPELLPGPVGGLWRAVQPANDGLFILESLLVRVRESSSIFIAIVAFTSAERAFASHASIKFTRRQAQKPSDIV